MRTFAAFSHRDFALIWAANTAALVGIAAFDAASAWLMTSLSPDPLMVSLVQTATVLPMFLLTLVGGAIADVVDPRRFLIVNSLLIALFVAAFATIVLAKAATSTALLAAIFALSGAWALNAPAWLALIPGLVPPEELDSATAAGGFSYNVSRLAGPAAFGLATDCFGASAPFWFFCCCNVAAVAVLIARRPPRRSEARLPPERVLAALRIGLRHAVHNRSLRATLARAGAFFLFASASSALLPLIARRALGRPDFYAAMLSAVALGAIAGSLIFVVLKRKFGLDRTADLGVALMSAALFLLGVSYAAPVLLASGVVVGIAGMIVLSSLYVSAQQALPDWVRARGLAILMTVIFGSVSLGSLCWGALARAADPSYALFAAAAGALLTLTATSRWPLEDASNVDLHPSLHWRTMTLARPVDDDEGPILVTVSYKVRAADRSSFLEAVEEVGHERRRDGATRWSVFEDVEEDGRYVEAFSLETWLDLRRLRERVTRADQLVERRIETMLTEARAVRFHVAPPHKARAPVVAAVNPKAMRALDRDTRA